MLTRRQTLFAGTAAIAALAFGRLLRPLGATAATSFEVTHTDEEWRKILTPDAYQVLRQEGTERPFTSSLLNEHRAGTFGCAGCDLRFIRRRRNSKAEPAGRVSGRRSRMRSSRSRTSPSAWSRTAVSCHRCGGHLGHVFNDGPKPTGLRYCMNGVALKFVAATPSSS